MANNPKKVKDPTEVALSAIQEALNISDAPPPTARRGSVRSDVTPTNSPSPPSYDEAAFDTRPSADRPIFEPIEEPRPTPPRRQRRPRNHRPDSAGHSEGPPCPQRLHARHAVRRRLDRRRRPADRQLPALAAGRDRPGQRRHAGAGRPRGVVLCAGAAVLFPREPVLARPGIAHDRAVDGAGRDPLFGARGRRQRLRWSPSARRSAAKSRRWATASNAPSRAPANSKPWSPTKSRRWSAPTATTKCASARCCRTSPISATTWSARPNRFAAPFPACRSTCATTSR